MDFVRPFDKSAWYGAQAQQAKLRAQALGGLPAEITWLHIADFWEHLLKLQCVINEGTDLERIWMMGER